MFLLHSTKYFVFIFILSTLKVKTPTFPGDLDGKSPRFSFQKYECFVPHTHPIDVCVELEFFAADSENP